jgi:hypothetical protein
MEVQMPWYQFLRDERARKLTHIEWLESGKLIVSHLVDGKTTDANGEMIADFRRHVAEIEQILAEAGEPFDA